MKALSIEEFAAISPVIHAAAERLGCTEVRISAPIWRGPAAEGPEGEQIRIAEYSWWRALLLADSVILEEDEPQKFQAVLAEYGLGEDEPVEAGASSEGSAPPISPAPEIAPGHEPVAPSTEPPVLSHGLNPVRVPVTAHVLDSTKTKMEQQANQMGLSLGGLLDRMFS